MNSVFLVTFLVAILPFDLLGAEPSAFGAGNLESSEPYGLTSSEKVILQNKDKLRKVVVKSNNQANEVDSLRERLDGLQSIIESLSKKSQENRLNLKSFDEKNAKELANANEYEKRLSKITQNNSENIKDIYKEIEVMKSLLEDIKTSLNNINANYVSRDEHNALVNNFNSFKQLVSKELKRISKSKKSKSSAKSNAEIANEAKRNYDRKYYTKSIEQYSYLIEKNYRPARAHYMIGEMKYYRKNYAEAIAYFKKSASLYQKASYMPVLLLHTAISMQKTGDQKNAKSFYQAVLSKYPNTKSASIAKNKLSEM